MRAEAADTGSISSRIDSSLGVASPGAEGGQEPAPDTFVVLPHSSHQPHPGPPPRPRPPPPARFPRPGPPPKPRRPSEGPLPMLSQPVIGLPQVPASRKQAPFLAKRPLLPPQLPPHQAFPGPGHTAHTNKPKLPQAPLSKPKLPQVLLKKPKVPQVPLKKATGAVPQKKVQVAKLAPPSPAPKPVDTKPAAKKPVLAKPLAKLPAKLRPQSPAASLSPNIIAKLTAQTKVPEKKPFDFR